MNSDSRNIWSSQESQRRPSYSQAYEESEFVQSDPTYHESFRCSQGSSRICKVSSKQQNPETRTFSQIQDYTQVNSEQLNLPQPEVKNLDIVSQNRENSKCLSHENGNFFDFGVSNQQSLFESSRTVEFTESQLREMRHQAENMGNIIPQTHDGRSSFQDHRQELGIKSNPPIHAFTGEFSQDKWVSRENNHFRPSDNHEVNNIENTFQVRPRNEHLYPENRNANNSVFSIQYLGIEHLFNQQYLPEYSIEQSTQQQNGNQRISEDLQKTLSVQADMQGTADPGQSAEIPTSYGIQVNQLSTSRAEENLFRSNIQSGKDTLIANRSINISPFSKDYLKNYHLSLNRQCLERNELVQPSQLYHGPRMNFVDDPEAFKAQTSPPKLPDQRLSEYTQSSGNRLFNPQSWTFNGGKSVPGLRNSGTSYTEINPHKSLQSASNIPENWGFGFYNDILWDESPISGESNASFLTRGHLAQETVTTATTSDEQNRYKLNISPSFATTSGELMHATSSVSNYHKNSKFLSKPTCLESNIIRFCSQQWENMSDSNVSTNANIPGNFTSYIEDANIQQGLKNSSQENRNFSRNCNLSKNYQEETQNQESFANSQYTSSELASHARCQKNQRLHACNTSSKRFNHESELDRHMQTHTNERPYPCTFCPKRFIQKGHLNRHIRIHTEERPYECTFCPKTFKQSAHLKRHIRSHKNERTHACDICGKRFNEKDNLKQHSLLHRKGKDASE